MLAGGVISGVIFMNRDMTAVNAQRRSMAIGIWSLLLVLMALVPSEVSELSAVVCVLIASTGSGIALLLIVSPSSRNQLSFRQRNACVAISFAIPLAWSFLMNARNNPSIGLFFTIIAVLPVIVMRLALVVRAGGHGGDSRQPIGNSIGTSIEGHRVRGEFF